MAKIAIVDDDESIALAIKDFLENEGFEAWHALDLNQFFALIRDNRPDLVIMDIQMPGGSGVTAIKNLQKSTDLAAIPVITLSAMPLAMQKQWLTGSPTTVRYMEKPMDLKSLLKEIKELLSEGGQGSGKD